MGSIGLQGNTELKCSKGVFSIVAANAFAKGGLVSECRSGKIAHHEWGTAQAAMKLQLGLH